MLYKIIISKEKTERELLLLVFENGRYIGNVPLMSVGTSIFKQHEI